MYTEALESGVVSMPDVLSITVDPFILFTKKNKSMGYDMFTVEVETNMAATYQVRVHLSGKDNLKNIATSSTTTAKLVKGKGTLVIGNNGLTNGRFDAFPNGDYDVTISIWSANGGAVGKAETVLRKQVTEADILIVPYYTLGGTSLNVMPYQIRVTDVIGDGLDVDGEDFELYVSNKFYQTSPTAEYDDSYDLKNWERVELGMLHNIINTEPRKVTVNGDKYWSLAVRIVFKARADNLKPGVKKIKFRYGLKKIDPEGE